MFFKKEVLPPLFPLTLIIGVMLLGLVIRPIIQWGTKLLW